MEAMDKHEGRSRCVDVTRNPDGTFTYTVIATLAGGNTELRFTTDPFFFFSLEFFDGSMQRNANGKTAVREIRFDLNLSGHVLPDSKNIYLTQRMVSSPYGDGKDQCGRELEGNT